MKELGHAGLNNLLVGFQTKEAWALCTFAYSAGPGTEPIIFEGKTDGSIVPARGSATFGWDAVFEPTGTGKTYVCIFTRMTCWLSCNKDMEKCLSKRKIKSRIDIAHWRN